MKKGKLFAGLLIVAAAVAVVIFFGSANRKKSGEPIPDKAPIQAKIHFGSEKKGLLADPEFQRIMKDKYGLVVDGIKMGSIEMAEGAIQGVDGLWPSSELASLIFTANHAGQHFKSQNIFNTPLVFYSWPEVTDALIKAGVVEKRDNTYYVVDLKLYLSKMVNKDTWKSLELPRQNGFIGIHSTDPQKSNSGFLLTGLMAVILNQGRMADSNTIEPHLETIREIYARMGFLENSTGTLFDKYVKQGQGAFPVISAYESLIIEFYQAYPDYRNQIKERMRVLIPEPTVWSEHPFIALTQNGEALLEALQDKQIQKLAWDKYGFRSGVMGIDHDPAILEEIGLPPSIDTVTPLPSPEVMTKILTALE